MKWEIVEQRKEDWYKRACLSILIVPFYITHLDEFGFFRERAGRTCSKPYFKQNCKQMVPLQTEVFSKNGSKCQYLSLRPSLLSSLAFYLNCKYLSPSLPIALLLLNRGSGGCCRAHSCSSLNLSLLPLS